MKVRNIIDDSKILLNVFRNKYKYIITKINPRLTSDLDCSLKLWAQAKFGFFKSLLPLISSLTDCAKYCIHASTRTMPGEKTENEKDGVSLYIENANRMYSLCIFIVCIVFERRRMILLCFQCLKQVLVM